jgi:uncharacterized membrane protein
MMFEQIKEFIRIHRSVNAHSWGVEHERVVRKAVKELNREGLILIPVQDGLFAHQYEDIEVCDDRTILRYVWTQIKSMRTNYLNNVKPIMKYVKDRRLAKLMGRLDGVMMDLLAIDGEDLPF